MHPKRHPDAPCPSGSMTLGSSCGADTCLSVYICVVFFRVMQVQLCVQDALEDTGRTLSVYAAVKGTVRKKSMRYLQKYILLQRRAKMIISEKFVTGNVFGITFQNRLLREMIFVSESIIR